MVIYHGLDSAWPLSSYKSRQDPASALSGVLAAVHLLCEETKLIYNLPPCISWRWTASVVNLVNES